MRYVIGIIAGVVLIMGAVGGMENDTLNITYSLNGVLPVKRTIKNNKFLYRQPCYGWRYFMLLLYIAHDISLVSLHAVSFEVVGCCSNLCN